MKFLSKQNKNKSATQFVPFRIQMICLFNIIPIPMQILSKRYDKTSLIIPLLGHCIATYYAMSRYLVKLTELETSWGHVDTVT